MKVSRRHWGQEAPQKARGLGPPRSPVGYRDIAPLGVQGQSPQKQNGFEVFALAEIGSPESNANNLE